MCQKPSAQSSTCTLGVRIQNCIHAFFYKWGHFVGRKPWTVIGASTVVALICMIRLLFPIEEEAATSPPPRIPASVRTLGVRMARPALLPRLSLSDTHGHRCTDPHRVPLRAAGLRGLSRHEPVQGHVGICTDPDQ